MKNRYLSLSAVFMLLAATGCADETVIHKVFKENKTEKVSEFIQYHNRVMLFTPAHIGYERIKPHSMYVGVEAFESPIFNKRRKTLVDVELRLGHNFLYNGTDHFTPFIVFGSAGINHSRSFCDVDYRFKEWGLLYGGVGFLYTHEFDRLFTLGVSVKGFLGGPVFQKHKKLSCPTAGTDIAVPFTFRFGKAKHWDFRLEPFFFGLLGEKSTGYFGWRNSLGYRF